MRLKLLFAAVWCSIAMQTEHACAGCLRKRNTKRQQQLNRWKMMVLTALPTIVCKAFA